MLKKQKISKKMITMFIIISLLASISGIVGLIVTIRLNTDYSKALVENGFVQGDLGKFNTALNRASALIRDMIFLNDDKLLSSTSAELDELKNEVDQTFIDLAQNCKTPEELKLIAIINENLPLYQEKREQVIEMGLLKKNDEALMLFQNEAKPYLDTIIDTTNELIELNTTMGNEVSNSLNAQTIFCIILILVIILIVTITSIILGTKLSLSISKPIVACSERLAMLAEGDLHSPVPVSDLQDEVGDMLRSMHTTIENVQNICKDIDINLEKVSNGNLDVEAKVDYTGDFISMKNSIDKIIASLNSTFHEINLSADQVTSGADQVAQGATILAQASTDQASSIQELSATITEVSEQVKTTADNAKEANQKSTSSSNEAENCNNQMQEMIKAMHDIQSISVEINGIIANIEDIASQTNLLSLNAAIEAARAGDAGRGFAVVAESVRKLASESAESVNNTAQLIQRNMQAVENGIQIANVAAHSMDTVVVSTQDTSSLINDISKAANRQSDAIEQIMLAINQISEIIQSNSATSEESSAASEELLAQAQLMKELISQFQLKNMH